MVTDSPSPAFKSWKGWADPPIVQTFDPGAIPVVTIAVSGPGSQRDISEYVDKNLRRRLETVTGVGQVLVIGARPRQINVVVDNAKLTAHGLTDKHLSALPLDLPGLFHATNLMRGIVPGILEPSRVGPG